MADETKPGIELPIDAWVRGGTTSAAYDNALAAQRADAERRRAIQDRQMAIAAQNPAEARMQSMKLGGQQTHAMIVLGLKHPKDGQIQDWITCELIVQPGDDGAPDELVLQMACPRCRKRNPQEPDITIRQSNRMFWLDTKRAGEFWVDPTDPTNIVTLAGTITSKDWMTCPGLGCGWRFKIDDSVVYTG